MPRQRRIQLSGATYYVTANGRNGKPIGLDEEDRNGFERLLEELQLRMNWSIIAWSLLDHRYHLILRLSKANLIQGMTCLQNSWVKLFNSRHDRSGSLFAGRYRSLIVEESVFLPALIQLIHRSPLSAGLIQPGQGLASYAWCSLRDYLLPRPARRHWVEVEAGFAALGFEDSSNESRLQHLEDLERVASEPDTHSSALPTLEGALKRGWCLGTPCFRKTLLKSLNQPHSSNSDLEQHPDHRLALRILKTGLALEGLTRESLEGLKKSDWRKRAIGRAIRRHTALPHEWIADNLNMGTPGRTAVLISEPPHASWGPGWQKARELIQALEQICCDTPKGTPRALRE